MQDAINDIAEIKSLYPFISEIGIFSKDIIVVYHRSKLGIMSKKTFNNATSLLEWCEEYLPEKEQ